MTHVLADLDGTLIDSTASVRRAWRAWAQRHRVDVAALEATMHGRPSAEVIAEFAPQLDPVAESAAIDLAQAARLGRRGRPSRRRRAARRR